MNSLNNIKGKILKEKEQKKLCLYFNKLSKLENLFICPEDYHKSLNLQKQILNIIKRVIISKIAQNYY